MTIIFTMYIWFRKKHTCKVTKLFKNYYFSPVVITLWSSNRNPLCCWIWLLLLRSRADWQVTTLWLQDLCSKLITNLSSQAWGSSRSRKCSDLGPTAWNFSRRTCAEGFHNLENLFRKFVTMMTTVVNTCSTPITVLMQ